MSPLRNPAIIRRLYPILIGAVVIPIPAIAGPPLSIDDPGILEVSQLEATISITATYGNEEEIYEIAALDVAYGIAENLQVFAVYPFFYMDPHNEPVESGFESMELGFKWRFYNSLYFQVAIAPNYAFNPDSSSSWFGIAGNYESVTLPVQLEYSVSKWTLNMELGYSVVKDDPDELSYGVALRHL